MKRLSLGLALAGVLLIILMVAYFGFGNVVGAIGRIGWTDFGVIIAWQLVLFMVLGVAWDVILPSRDARRPWVVIWGRMVRDASSNCLPFSAVGGFVFGARAATVQGMRWQTATASTVIDVTAEFLAQIAFAAIGLGILLARAPSSQFAVPVEVGIGLAVLACFGFIWAQRGGAATVFARMGRGIAARWFANAEERIAVVQSEMAVIYGHPGRLACGFGIHLLGWLATGMAGWLIYRALGVPIAFDHAVAIEALLAAVAALAFLVPVNAGVQEASYAGLGMIFGVPPELSLGVSLVRRARDIAVGLPILLVWQYTEMRRMRQARRTSVMAGTGAGSE